MAFRKKVNKVKHLKRNYFARLVDNDDKASSKRFLGLLMSGFLIIAFFVILFTRVPSANEVLLDRAMLYAFLIVLMSFFGLAVDKVSEILLKISKTQAAARVLSPTAINKVENVQGDIQAPINKNRNEDDDEDDIKNTIDKIDKHINYD